VFLSGHPTSIASSASKPSGQWQPPSLEEMQAMLPQYQFEKLPGRGGMGAVYKAVQASLQRRQAMNGSMVLLGR